VTKVVYLEGGEMKDLTRRRFLTHTSIGVVFAGALALVPGAAAALKLPVAAPKAGGRAAIAGDPLVAHVRDFATGEIAFLVGSQRFIVRDRELAARLHSAAQRR
jgi:Mg/Co/Ni transporter MgtE